MSYAIQELHSVLSKVTPGEPPDKHLIYASALLAELAAPRVSVLGKDGWQVMGTEPISEATVVVSGRIGSDAINVKRWALEGEADTERAFLAGDTLYRVTVRPAPWALSRWATMWMLLGPRLSS